MVAVQELAQVIEQDESLEMFQDPVGHHEHPVVPDEVIQSQIKKFYLSIAPDVPPLHKIDPTK